jgi:hypothetical protein
MLLRLLSLLRLLRPDFPVAKAWYLATRSLLWTSVRSILETVWPNGPTTDLDAVENVIGQFHKLDLTSMAFRYPVDLKNNATLSGLAHVGPRNLMEVMQRTSSLLEASSSAISSYLDDMRGSRD